MADLDNIANYIGSRSPLGSIRVQRRLKAVIEHLPDHPFTGKRTSDPMIRRVIAAPYPYLIFYEVTETEVIIHAVRHGARDPGTMPG